ncbi:MAG: hypothetical protein WD851_00165 [Pirellulales bacterium]
MATSTLDTFMDPAAGWLTPDVAERIVNWRPDQKVKDRIAELGRKADEGTLSPEEDAEYEQYIEDGDLIAILQLKAEEVLESNKH